MALTKLTENLNVHQSLPDKPALSADELKIKFDEAPNKIKDYLNETLVKELDSIVSSLQTKDTNIEKIATDGKKIANDASTSITNLTTQVNKLLDEIKTGAKTKISKGKNVPTSLEEGEIYFQYFD